MPAKKETPVKMPKDKKIPVDKGIKKEVKKDAKK
jgi:hypothetical protein